MDDSLGYQFKDAESEVIRVLGEPFEIEHAGEVRAAKGQRHRDGRRATFLADAKIEPGDVLRSTVSGEVLYVIDVAKPVEAGVMTCLIVQYETKTQRDQRLAADQRREASAFTINTFGPVQGSILGTQQHANLTVTFDLRSLELDIDRRGGDDTEALKAMVADIREMLDDREKISRGSLIKFSELLERHSWIAGAVAQALLGWATSSLK